VTTGGHRLPYRAGVDIDWTFQLHEQLDTHWRHRLRPRLTGLTDEEYFWEPVAGCWNVRRRGEGTAPMAIGAGDFTVDVAIPDPDPAPVTTIAWRIAHVVVGVFGDRTANHFGGPPADYDTFVYAGTADEALAQVDEAYRNWSEGVRGLDAERLARPCGAVEESWEDAPLAELVLHINREAIHHGAEICLLRDLYAHRSPDGPLRP